jgi:hypothetical protein
MTSQPGKPRRLFRKILLLLLLVFVFLYACGVAAIYFGQTSMVFPRGGSVWRTPADPAFDWSYEDVTMRVGEETTHGWYLPVDNARGTLLFCHANAGTVADRFKSYVVFRELRLNVFIFDYGGYGNSTGSPSEERCYADARAAWHYLTEERGEQPNRIIIFGRSLGGGVAADLAAGTKPAAVILESTYVSIVQMGREIFPVAPVNWFIRYRFETDKKITQIRAPILIIHSPEDEVIPYHHGRRLFELAPEPKSFLEIHGAHYTGWFDSGMLYSEGIGAFLKPILPGD